MKGGTMRERMAWARRYWSVRRLWPALRALLFGYWLVSCASSYRVGPNDPECKWHCRLPQGACCNVLNGTCCDVP